jgi:hypothetical protein
MYMIFVILMITLRIKERIIKTKRRNGLKYYIQYLPAGRQACGTHVGFRLRLLPIDQALIFGGCFLFVSGETFYLYPADSLPYDADLLCGPV